MIGEEVNPEKIEKVDLIVGIPSYKEADNIAFPVEQSAIGLKKYTNIRFLLFISKHLLCRFTFFQV